MLSEKIVVFESLVDTYIFLTLQFDWIDSTVTGFRHSITNNIILVYRGSL